MRYVTEPIKPIQIPATEAGLRFLDTYMRIFNEVNIKSGGSLRPLTKEEAKEHRRLKRQTPNVERDPKTER